MRQRASTEVAAPSGQGHDVGPPAERHRESDDRTETNSARARTVTTARSLKGCVERGEGTPRTNSLLGQQFPMRASSTRPQRLPESADGEAPGCGAAPTDLRPLRQEHRQRERRLLYLQALQRRMTATRIAFLLCYVIGVIVFACGLFRGFQYVPVDRGQSDDHVKPRGVVSQDLSNLGSAPRDDDERFVCVCLWGEVPMCDYHHTDSSETGGVKSRAPNAANPERWRTMASAADSAWSRLAHFMTHSSAVIPPGEVWSACVGRIHRFHVAQVCGLVSFLCGLVVILLGLWRVYMAAGMPRAIAAAIAREEVLAQQCDGAQQAGEVPASALAAAEARAQRRLAAAERGCRLTFAVSHGRSEGRDFGESHNCRLHCRCSCLCRRESSRDPSTGQAAPVKQSGGCVFDIRRHVKLLCLLLCWATVLLGAICWSSVADMYSRRAGADKKSLEQVSALCTKMQHYEGGGTFAKVLPGARSNGRAEDALRDPSTHTRGSFGEASEFVATAVMARHTAGMKLGGGFRCLVAGWALQVVGIMVLLVL